MDSEWALEVMHKAPYITVSFIDEDGKPYGLPLSLASDDDMNWYFHGALEGKKLEAIKAHPEVCLSAVTRCAPVPCHARLLFASRLLSHQPASASSMIRRAWK